MKRGSIELKSIILRTDGGIYREIMHISLCSLTILSHDDTLFSGSVDPSFSEINSKRIEAMKTFKTRKYLGPHPFILGFIITLGIVVVSGLIYFIPWGKLGYLYVDSADDHDHKDDPKVDALCDESLGDSIEIDRESGLEYVDNEISIDAKGGVSKEELSSLARKYNASIVCYSEISEHYRWRFSRSYTLDELENIVAGLHDNRYVSKATVVIVK